MNISKTAKLSEAKKNDEDKECVKKLKKEKKSA